MRASDVALDEGLELARRLHLDDPVDFPAALERDHRRDVLHGVLRDDLRILLGVAGGEDGAFGVDSRELREEGLGAAAVGAPARADGENHGLVGCNHGFDVGVVDHHDVVHENFSFKRTGAFGAAGSPASGMSSFDLLDVSYHVPSANCKRFLLAGRDCGT